MQYQFVVPFGARVDARAARALLASGIGAPFLAVLKRFGPGVGAPLSFPIAGWTLALDIPARAPGLGALLDELDELVAAAGGRVYLAKDARLDRGAAGHRCTRGSASGGRSRLDPCHVIAPTSHAARGIGSGRPRRRSQRDATRLERSTSILVLGGGSRHRARDRARRCVTGGMRTGRPRRAPPRGRDAAVADLSSRSGVAASRRVDFDAADHDDARRAIVRGVRRRRRRRRARRVRGARRPGGSSRTTPTLAVAAAQANYVGAVSVCLPRPPATSPVRGTARSSCCRRVAGERARRIELRLRLDQGRASTLWPGARGRHASGAGVLVVRPGFVRTGMTRGLDPAPLATTPDEVAKAIVDGLSDRRRSSGFRRRSAG